ncbi:MAG TPA: oxidoreductase [Spirochaeta sp.]|nr:oxidoreductase [Spirochaeta sp.]
MDNVIWGMIGCGDVTEIKSGPGLYKSESSELKGVFNRTLAKAESYAERHNLKKVYHSAEEMLKDDEINAVYIATPPNSHKDYAIACLNAGKIPYIEKPLAMSYKECIEIESCAKKKKLPVFTAYYRRGIEKFIKIKELIDSGAIGNIRYVTVSQVMSVEKSELYKKDLPWRVIPEISGGGKFLDMGTHVLDCLIWYFGQMVSLDGVVLNQGGYYEAEDTVAASFQFKNGVCGSGTWCYVGDKNKNEVQIAGDAGRIIYDGLSVKSFKLIQNDEVKVFNFKEPEHVAMPFEQAVVYELTGRKKSFANFNDAVNLTKKTMELLAGYY